MSRTVNQKALELAIANLNKNYGANTVIHGRAELPDMEFIPTGNFKLDMALGIGGLPKGRIVHLYGPESTGKSLLSLGTIAECQAQGGLCAYIDAECDFDPVWAEKRGVKVEDLYFAQPETGEEAFTILRELVQTGAFDLIVVDSVAALTPLAEMEGSMEDNHMGLQARMIGQGLRMTRNLIHANDTCVIFINQLRDKLTPGGGSTTPGGRALKFFSSVMIETRKVQNLTTSSTNESIGTRIKALVVKNKVGNPMRAVEYDMIHGKGIDNFRSILEMSIKQGLITQKGPYYYKAGEEKTFAQGTQNAVEVLASDLEWTNELKAKILANAQ